MKINSFLIFWLCHQLKQQTLFTTANRKTTTFMQITDNQLNWRIAGYIKIVETLNPAFSYEVLNIDNGITPRQLTIESGNLLRFLGQSVNLYLDSNFNDLISNTLTPTSYWTGFAIHFKQSILRFTYKVYDYMLNTPTVYNTTMTESYQIFTIIITSDNLGPNILYANFDYQNIANLNVFQKYSLMGLYLFEYYNQEQQNMYFNMKQRKQNKNLFIENFIRTPYEKPFGKYHFPFFSIKINYPYQEEIIPLYNITFSMVFFLQLRAYNLDDELDIVLYQKNLIFNNDIMKLSLQSEIRESVNFPTEAALNNSVLILSSDNYLIQQNLTTNPIEGSDIHRFKIYFCITQDYYSTQALSMVFFLNDVPVTTHINQSIYFPFSFLDQSFTEFKLQNQSNYYYYNFYLEEIMFFSGPSIGSALYSLYTIPLNIGSSTLILNYQNLDKKFIRVAPNDYNYILRTGFVNYNFKGPYPEFEKCPQIKNCKLCTSNECFQCEEGYYYQTNQCLSCDFPNIVIQNYCYDKNTQIEFNYQVPMQPEQSFEYFLDNFIQPYILNDQILYIRIILEIQLNNSTNVKLFEKTFSIKKVEELNELKLLEQNELLYMTLSYQILDMSNVSFISIENSFFCSQYQYLNDLLNLKCVNFCTTSTQTNIFCIDYKSGCQEFTNNLCTQCQTNYIPMYNTNGDQVCIVDNTSLWEEVPIGDILVSSVQTNCLYEISGTCVICQLYYELDSNSNCIQIDCTKIDQNCISCVNDQCSACSDYYYLQDNQCIYGDFCSSVITIQNQKCDACQVGYYLYSNQSCNLSICTNPNYIENSICVICEISNCQTCVTSNRQEFIKQDCTSCEPGYSLTTLSYYEGCLDDSSLIDNCQIYNQTGSRCLQCLSDYSLVSINNLKLCINDEYLISNCTKYDSNNQCDECENNNVLFINNIHEDFPNNVICVSTQNQDQDGDCLLDFEYIQSVCVSENCFIINQYGLCNICQNGYSYENSYCKGTVDNCISYSEQGTCNQCKKYYTLINGECQTDQLCLNEVENCNQCSSEQQLLCSKCEDEYILVENFCYCDINSKKCKTNSQISQFNSKVCLSIDLNCLVCNKDYPYLCSQCRSHYELNTQNECQLIKVDCTIGCNLCYETYSCEQCETGFILLSGFCFTEEEYEFKIDYESTYECKDTEICYQNMDYINVNCSQCQNKCTCEVNQLTPSSSLFSCNNDSITFQNNISQSEGTISVSIYQSVKLKINFIMSTESSFELTLLKENINSSKNCIPDFETQYIVQNNQHFDFPQSRAVIKDIVKTQYSTGVNLIIGLLPTTYYTLMLSFMMNRDIYNYISKIDAKYGYMYNYFNQDQDFFFQNFIVEDSLEYETLYEQYSELVQSYSFFLISELYVFFSLLGKILIYILQKLYTYVNKYKHKPKVFKILFLKIFYYNLQDLIQVWYNNFSQLVLIRYFTFVCYFFLFFDFFKWQYKIGNLIKNQIIILIGFVYILQVLKDVRRRKNLRNKKYSNLKQLEKKEKIVLIFNSLKIFEFISFYFQTQFIMNFFMQQKLTLMLVICCQGMFTLFLVNQLKEKERKIKWLYIMNIIQELSFMMFLTVVLIQTNLDINLGFLDSFSFCLNIFLKFSELGYYSYLIWYFNKDLKLDDDEITIQNMMKKLKRDKQIQMFFKKQFITESKVRNFLDDHISRNKSNMWKAPKSVFVKKTQEIEDSFEGDQNDNHSPKNGIKKPRTGFIIEKKDDKSD